MLVDYTHYGMSVPRSLPSAFSKPYAKFLTLPDSLVFLGFNFILPKRKWYFPKRGAVTKFEPVYINSLLAM